MIKNSNYLKFKFKDDINNIEKLYLHEIYITFEESLDPLLLLGCTHKGKISGRLSFNDFKYEICFNTQQIIDDFLKYLNLYLINCIKAEDIINKNKIKYLIKPKTITKIQQRNVTIDVKNKIYNFNHKDNPLYNSNLKNSWMLTVERKEKQISKQIKLRKEFIITYQYTNEKLRKIKGYGINSKHKGCAIGKLMDDLLGNDNKITFKNLTKIRDYDIPQLDFLLICLFFIIKSIDEKYITKNYLSKEWFLDCGIKMEDKDLMELEFP